MKVMERESPGFKKSFYSFTCSFGVCFVVVWNFQTVSQRRHPSLYIPKFPNVVQVHGYLYLCTHGTTPLDIAIRNNQSRNVQMLVESGAHRGLGIRCGRGIRFSGSALWTHVDGKKRMDWTYIYIELQTIIHFSNSIHSYIFSSDIQIVQILLEKCMSCEKKSC